ncbi:lanthionine synthetase LanC family protein, partial [Methylorubrum thiocyanatum]|uniref:lanthionine synthetase LanC family protein n=1 Tax=Methylorubrum thiocyanatum TaxID=47958 RepID=UPI0035C808BE
RFLVDAELFAGAAPKPGTGSPADAKVGLAHGEAGLGIALLKLARASGDSHYLEQAWSCLKCEREARAALQLAGLDGRYEDRISTEISWCGGSTGMLLLASRLYGPQHLPDDVGEGVAWSAARTIAKNDSLCCGAFGHAIVHREIASPLAPDILGKLCASRKHGPWALLDRQFDPAPPGLFSGIAGIGLSYLSAAVENPAISILTFEVRPRTSAGFAGDVFPGKPCIAG